MKPSVQVDINAANNWWGTTETATIDQKIYDYNDDFNLGKVNYTPFLTEPNSQAVPNPNAPTPTLAPTTPPTSSPSKSPTPSQEPQQPDLTIIVGVAIVAVVLGAGLGLLIYLAKRK
jgi:heme-binding NEAT domain protein